MPAYFEMSLQFLRKDLYPDFIADFDAHLAKTGLKFLDGCWEDEGLSQTKIAAWNQKKLDSDFVLGYTTHRSHDYKQTLYDFGGYEEVRVTRTRVITPSSCRAERPSCGSWRKSCGSSRR